MWPILEVKQAALCYRVVIMSILAIDITIFYQLLQNLGHQILIYDTCSLFLKSTWILLRISDVYASHAPTWQEKPPPGKATTISRSTIVSGMVTLCLTVGRAVWASRLHEEFSFMAIASCCTSIVILLLSLINIKPNTHYMPFKIIRIFKSNFRINFRSRDAIIASSPMILKNMSELIILGGGLNVYLTTVSNPEMVNNESKIIIAIESMRCVTSIVCSQLRIPASPFPRVAPLMNQRQSLLGLPFTLGVLVYRAMSQRNVIDGIMVVAHFAGTGATYLMLHRNVQDLPISHSPTVDEEDSMECFSMITSALSTATAAAAISYQDTEGAHVGWWICCGLNFAVSVFGIPTIGHRTTISEMLAEKLNELSRIYDELVVESLPENYKFIARFGKDLLQQHFPFVYVCSLLMFYLSISSKTTPSIVVSISALTLGYFTAIREFNKRDRVRLLDRQLESLASIALDNVENTERLQLLAP